MWVIAWEETPVLSWRQSDLSSCPGSHSGKMKEMCAYFAFTPRCKRCTRSNILWSAFAAEFHHVPWTCRHFPENRRSCKPERIVQAGRFLGLHPVQERLFPHRPQMCSCCFCLRSDFLGEVLSRQWLTVILSAFLVRTQMEWVVEIIILFLIIKTGLHFVLCCCFL